MRMRWVQSTLALAMFASVARGAPADPVPSKQDCIDAFDKEQALRAQNKLRAARDAARTCSASACGKLSGECGQAAFELEKLIPTVVFEVKDGDGHDLSAVKVSMDGTKLADKLDGAALEVDIGDHEFTFDANGQSAKQRFVIREGDKVRHERVTIGLPAVTTSPITAPTAPPTTAPVVDQPKPDPPPTAAPDTGSSGTGQRVAGVVIAAAGLVSAAIGAYYLVSYSNDQSAFPNDGQLACGGLGKGTTCSAAQDLKSSIESESVKGGIALGIGGALMVTGLIVLLTAPSGHKAATSSLQIVPVLGRGNGGLLLGGAF